LRNQPSLAVVRAPLKFHLLVTSGASHLGVKARSSGGFIGGSCPTRCRFIGSVERARPSAIVPLHARVADSDTRSRQPILKCSILEPTNPASVVSRRVKTSCLRHEVKVAPYHFGRIANDEHCPAGADLLQTVGACSIDRHGLRQAACVRTGETIRGACLRCPTMYAADGLCRHAVRASVPALPVRPVRGLDDLCCCEIERRTTTPR
jgi:hypothetical protein